MGHDSHLVVLPCWLLPANTFSICLGRSQICSKRKEIAIDKFWESKLWLILECGGRREIYVVKMSSPAEPASLPHCSGTCNETEATCSPKAGSGNRSSCTPSLILGTPQHAAAMAQPYRLVQRRHQGEWLRPCRKDRHMGISISNTWWGYEEKDCVGFPFHC